MLIRQTILYLPAQILAPLVQFASVLIWSHLLEPSELGVVTILVAIQEVAYIGFFGWWSLAMLRFISAYTEGEERRAYVRTESAATLGSSILQTAVLFPATLYYFGGEMGPIEIALALLFIFTRSANNYLADRARAEAQILLYTLVQTVGPVVGFGFGLLCIWLVGPTSASVMAGFVVAQLVGIGFGVAFSDFWRHFGAISMPIVKQAAGFGAIQSVSRLLAVVAINAPRFLVASLLGLAAVGQFAVGYSLGIRASSFAVTLVTAGAYPLVVKKMNSEGPEAAFRQLSQNMVLVVLTVAPVAFGLLGINQSLVHLLVDPQYQAVTLAVLPLATIGGLFRYLRAHTSDQVFLLNLKPGYGTWVAVLDIIVAVLSAWIGIHMLGIAGAALGPMASGIATFLFSFLLSRVRFGYKAPLGAFFRILLAGAVMGAVVAMMPVASSPLWLAAHVAIGGGLYAGLVMLLMPEERKLAMGLVERKFGRRLRGAG